MTPSRMLAALSSSRWQIVAILVCVLFGVAIIANVELSGEGVWFWYATLLHQGQKLYAQMHLPLQPWFVLETDFWLRVLGPSAILYQAPALLRVIALCVGVLLLLRESDWPDGAKAVLLASAFFLFIHFNAYRFDDFHIVADALYVYAIVLLLALRRATSRVAEWRMAAALGLLAAIALTNRLTDGGALMVAVAISVLVLADRSRIASGCAYLLTFTLCVLLIVHLTGDTLHDYLANSIFHAASAKGGTGTVLRGPAVALLDSFRRLRHGGKWILLWTAAIACSGVVVERFTRRRAAWIIAAELGVAAAGVLISSPLTRAALADGAYIGPISTMVQPLTYVLCIVIAVRMSLAWLRSEAWDSREVLAVVPLATLLSAAASQANGTSNSFITLALLILLTAALVPFGAVSLSTVLSVTVIAGLMGLSGAIYKVKQPYSWNTYDSGAMFTNRVWYRHPLYGPMYIDRSSLAFHKSLCAVLQNSGGTPELLTLPYPYPNYFCGIPPWHGYVQTWFDTATPATIEQLMRELESAPPEWVLYQRQLPVLRAHETEYNHGQPIAHRALDTLIMSRIASGEWQVVMRSSYLVPPADAGHGDGWYLLKTHP